MVSTQNGFFSRGFFFAFFPLDRTALLPFPFFWFSLALFLLVTSSSLLSLGFSLFRQIWVKSAPQLCPVLSSLFRQNWEHTLFPFFWFYYPLLLVLLSFFLVLLLLSLCFFSIQAELDAQCSVLSCSVLSYLLSSGRTGFTPVPFSLASTQTLSGQR